jgi:hypothetical protein
MKNKPEHLPIIIGVFMLFVVFLVSGGLIVYFVSSDIVQQHSDDFQASEDSENSNQESNQLRESEESELNMTVAPPPAETQGGGMTGIDTNSSAEFSTGSTGTTGTSSQTNITTGTNSSTPNYSGYTSESSSSSQQSSYGMSNLGSSVERNRSIQENLSTGMSDYSNSNFATPDYSSPSSSNNFNQTNNQSLIEPSEDNSLLDTSNDSLLEPPDDSIETLDDSEETTTGITSTPSTDTTNTSPTSPLDKLP